MKKQAIATLALITNIGISFQAAAHDDEILEACPNLKEKAVKTVTITSDFSITSQNYTSKNAVHGTISEETLNSIRNNYMWSDVDQNNNPVEYTGNPHLLMINSTGGSVHSAQGIIDLMRMNDFTTTTTLCANQATSAAISILASGHNRYAFESCVSIIHFGTENLSGNSKRSIKEQSTFFQKLEATDEKFLTNKLLSKTCYQELKSNGDTYLNADNLLSLGIIDAILKTDNQMKVRADDHRITLQKCTTPIEKAYNALENQESEQAKELERKYQACVDQFTPD